MPVDLVNPNVTPVGAGIPNSPLINMFGQALGAYGRSFPTQLESADARYKNVETQKTQQELQGNNALAGIFQQAFTPQTVPDPSAAPVEGPRPDPSMVGPEPSVAATRQQTPDEAVRGALPGLVTALAQGNKVQNTPQLARMMAAFVPGAAADVQSAPIGKPSGLDLAMLGAGDSYESTPGGMREKNQAGFTSEQKNRGVKIQSIMSSQGVDYPTAEGLTDGVLDLTTDQNGNRVLVNKATGGSKLLYSTNPGAVVDGVAVNQPMGSPAAAPAVGAAPQPTPAAAPGAAPAVGPKPLNNPGNLRPVGDNANFMQFATPQQGMTALQNDLAIKLSGKSQAMGGKTPTLTNIISTYSPPNENATAALIANASRRMGIDPNAPLTPAQLPQLTQAILQQEQGGTSAAAAPPPAVASPSPTPANAATLGQPFKMNPGDIGVPFDQMYGGPAVAGRAQHMLGAVMGDQTPDPAVTAFGKLTNIKNGLASAFNNMPGRSANEGGQQRTLEQFPETDSDLLEHQIAAGQSTVNPSDAEQKFNQAIEQGAQIYTQADDALKSPFMDAKTRDSYQQIKNTVQKTFETNLPADTYNRFAAATGAPPLKGAPQVADMSNRDKGAAMTASDDEIPVVQSRAEAMKIDPGLPFRDSKGVVWLVVGPGNFQKVQ
jgi:hypothetical protein